jgi:hypothetical protein
VEAARAPAEATDLAAIQAEAQAVLAAVDPALAPERQATNYGAQRAVREARMAVDAALADAPLVAAVVRLRPQVQMAALLVEDRLVALVASATRLLAARTATEARAEAPTLRRLAAEVVMGTDVDRDGVVTFAPGEPGLVQWRMWLRALAVHARTGAGLEVGR